MGGKCASGYTGYMCNTCDSSFYSSPDGQCVACGSVSIAFLAVGIAVITVGAVVSVVYLGADTVVLDGSVSAASATLRRMTAIPHTINLSLVFIQVLSLLGTLRMEWPSSASEVFRYASVASFDVSLVASECELQSFWTRWLVSVTYPALYFGIAACVAWFLSFTRGWSWIIVMSRIVAALAPLLYLPLSTSTLSFFDCIKLPDGKYYLDADLGKLCFEGTWSAYAPLAVVAFAAYVVGIPVWICGVLYVHRSRLGETYAFSVYGGIYRLFRRPFWQLAPVLFLVKRLVLIVIALFLSEYVVLQIAALMAVTTCSTAWHMASHPFFLPLYNSFAGVLEVILVILLLIGFLFFVNDFPSGETRTVFVVILIILFVVAFAYIVTHIFLEFRLRRTLLAAHKSQAKGDEAFVENENDVLYTRFERAFFHDVDDWTLPSLTTFADQLSDVITARQRMQGEDARMEEGNVAPLEVLARQPFSSSSDDSDSGDGKDHSLQSISVSDVTQSQSQSLNASGGRSGKRRVRTKRRAHRVAPSLSDSIPHLPSPNDVGAE